MPYKKQLYIRFSEEDYNNIKELSEKFEISCSVIVRWAVKDYFERLGQEPNA